MIHNEKNVHVTRMPQAWCSLFWCTAVTHNYQSYVVFKTPVLICYLDNGSVARFWANCFTRNKQFIVGRVILVQDMPSESALMTYKISHF